MSEFMNRHIANIFRKMIRGNLILNDGKAVICDMPKGHGRIFITDKSNGCRMIVSAYTARCAVLGIGADEELAGEKIQNMIPALAIKIYSPESAEAWAYMFGKMAEVMRKDLELEKEG